MNEWPLYASISMDVLFLCALFLASWTDIKKREIPNAVVIVIAVLGIASTVFCKVQGISAKEHIYGMVMAMPLIIPGLLGYMGGGDYKLIMATGLYLGLTHGITAIILSCPVIIGVGLWHLVKNKTMKIKIPLAPVIGIGSLATVILRWLAGI